MEKLLQPPSLQERTYRVLRRAIITREFAGGERLIEVNLADRLGISRSPVREALLRLQQDGLVEALPAGGYVVATVTPKEVDDFYRLRGALEGVATALAAERMTTAEVAELDQMVERMDDAYTAGDYTLLVETADRFHKAINDGARNGRLTNYLGLLREQINQFRVKTLRMPGRAGEAVRGHREILEAIRARDSQRSEALMRAHVEEARLELRRHLAQLRVPGADDEASS